jgi:hypothetical protein
MLKFSFIAVQIALETGGLLNPSLSDTHTHTHFSTIAVASFRSHFHLKISSQDISDICESFLDFSAVPYMMNR